MLTRREFLAATTAAAALATTPSGAIAQTPKRGGTLAVRAWDPPHFDHSLVHAAGSLPPGSTAEMEDDRLSAACQRSKPRRSRA
jgi:hypothetical protein